MAKKGKKPTLAKAPNVTRLEVSNYEPLAHTCRRAIESALGQSALALDAQKASENRVICRFITGTFVTARAKYPYRVIPFFESKFSKFWLAVTLEFQFQSGIYVLTNVNLLIFEGAASDENKTPLIRAEWDCVQKIGVQHAQPHWHIYPSRLNREIEEYRTVVDQIELEEFDSDFSPSTSREKDDVEWARGGRFHFAMSAYWARDGADAQNDPVDQDSLLRWLDGCIKYTYGQFRFLYERDMID